MVKEARLLEVYPQSWGSTASSSCARSAGALPTNFWTVPIPQQFATTDPNNYDIRNLNGFKPNRLRKAYDTSFGQLHELQLPRYLQFGIRIFF